MKKKIKRQFHDYEDMLHLPHYESSRRPKMPIEDRAAQFAPFAAVVGHESAVKEAARVTHQRKELDEMEKMHINDQLSQIELDIDKGYIMEIVYFQSDPLKVGGEYLTSTGKVKKIDKYESILFMEDNTQIAIHEIYSISKSCYYFI